MNLNIKNKKLDSDWIKLIKKAKALGLTKSEIRSFLNEFKRNTFMDRK